MILLLISVVKIGILEAKTFAYRAANVVKLLFADK